MPLNFIAAAQVRQAASELGLRVVDMTHPWRPSEDFGWYLNKAGIKKERNHFNLLASCCSLHRLRHYFCCDHCEEYDHPDISIYSAHHFSTRQLETLCIETDPHTFYGKYYQSD